MPTFKVGDKVKLIRHNDQTTEELSQHNAYGVREVCGKSIKVKNSNYWFPVDLFKPVMTKVEALMLTYKAWDEIAKRGLTSKSEVESVDLDFIKNECPCCEYVVRTMGASCNAEGCGKYCPMWESWGGNVCENKGPYDEWTSWHKQEDAREIASLAIVELDKLGVTFGAIDFYDCLPILKETLKDNLTFKFTVGTDVRIEVFAYFEGEYHYSYSFDGTTSIYIRSEESMVKTLADGNFNKLTIKEVEFVKEASIIIKILEDAGYEPNDEGAWKKKGDIGFDSSMFQYCGKKKPCAYVWKPEWLMKKEV